MAALVQLLPPLLSLAKDRDRLALENAALRHQLAVLERTVKRPHIQDSDRISWIMMRRLLEDRQDALIFVRPETAIRWHRRGWKYCGKRESKFRKGRSAADQFQAQPPERTFLHHHLDLTAACASSRSRPSPS